MERVQAGMAAISMAGHDRGHLYLILELEGDYAYLADGRLRTAERPKKKKLMHMQVIKSVPEGFRDSIDREYKNEEIKRILKSLKMTNSIQEV
ncbi:KOW domain-containing RNA-binding protein [Murimonas intestini]|uniref:KOW domain-containing RNA-binding protein n=1 Tax=Murimonas intestini TaxID=1337051 RepID=UPI0011DDC6F1|nr:KOW domain-containing RNA-binding protein [Murimonas intestini]